MKTKQLRTLAALLLALLLCLTACGGSGKSASHVASSAASYAVAPAAMAPREEALFDAAEVNYKTADSIGAAAGSSAEAPQLETDRKIVYTGSMDLQTKEFDSVLAAITDLVREAGGYISSQEITGRSLTYRGNYYERRANLTVRVPAAKFEGLMAGVAGICNVTDRSVWTDDISERYYDAEAHLSTLRLQEERLLEILAKAEKLEDVITLEQALSNVRYEIESLTAQLRRMDDRVDYSTLTLSLQEVVEYSEIETPPATFGEKVAEAARRSARSIREFFEDLILWIIEDLPVALLRLVLIVIVLWVLVRVLRFVFRRSGIKTPKKPLFCRRKKETASAPKEDDAPAPPQE